MGNYASTGDFEVLPSGCLDTSTFEEIGSGNFGVVYKGRIRFAPGLVVAIKELKNTASREEVAEFEKEAATLSSLKNQPNILEFIGAIYGTRGVKYLVFEYMSRGDLLHVLKHPPKLSEDQKLWMSIQIADGMAVLAARKIVHRDLACRNCLVGEGDIVKIADFGMSRDVYSSHYYRAGGDKPLPVRWMAPESLEEGVYTVESDVWSFGVVLWEIYSQGAVPYRNFSNEYTMELIIEGETLSPPDNCPPVVSDVMQACWEFEPTDRIRFSEISRKLKSLYKRRYV